MISNAPSSPSHLQTQYVPGDYITYECLGSEITGLGVTLCDNQASHVVDSCDSSTCLISVTDKPLSGSFEYWTSSGDAYVATVTGVCATTQYSLSNPTSLCMHASSPSGRYSGVLSATV
jgi:hypothetical protein